MINPSILRREQLSYDTWESLNKYFPGRAEEHYKIYSPLLSSLIIVSYENGSGQQEYTVNEKAASEFAGADIKSFAESASKMEKLVKVVR